MRDDYYTNTEADAAAFEAGASDRYDNDAPTRDELAEEGLLELGRARQAVIGAAGWSHRSVQRSVSPSRSSDRTDGRTDGLTETDHP